MVWDAPSSYELYAGSWESSEKPQEFRFSNCIQNFVSVVNQKYPKFETFDSTVLYQTVNFIPKIFYIIGSVGP